MSVYAEQLAASALRDWLLAQLPAKVTAVNLQRAASLRAPFPGPYTLAAGATLGVAFTDTDTFTSATLSVGGGSLTAAQVATAINAAAAPSSPASTVDLNGLSHLVLTSPTPPVIGTNSYLKVRGGVNGTDANAVFGWDTGGEKTETTALIAPNGKGVVDGLPLVPDFGISAYAGGSPIVIIIGDRNSVPVGPSPTRRDEYLVTLAVDVLRIEPQQQVHRNREHIHAAVRCVRECLLTDMGRRLGAPTTDGGTQSPIVYVGERATKVAAMPFRFNAPKDQAWVSPLFDGAAMLIEVRVFERPAAT